MVPGKISSVAGTTEGSMADTARVGVVADTHLFRRGRELPAALRDGLAGVDLIVHLGDFTDPGVPALFEAIAPLEAVAGNNDGPDLVMRFGRRRVLTVAGARLGLVHGDHPRWPARVAARQAFGDDRMDVVCYGHSHVPELAQEAGIWYVNPGSPTDKRRLPDFTYALLTIRAGHVDPALITLPRHVDAN